MLKSSCMASVEFVAIYLCVEVFNINSCATGRIAGDGDWRRWLLICSHKVVGCTTSATAGKIQCSASLKR